MADMAPLSRITTRRFVSNPLASANAVAVVTSDQIPGRVVGW